MKKISKIFVLFFVITYSFSSVQINAVDMKRILKDFEEIALKGMKEDKIPGMAIGIVLNDEVVYLKGFGVKKEGSSDKIEPNTVFQLASVTKPLTGTVVAAAISQGLLSWDDKVNKYVPNFKLKADWVTDQFMVRDALSHRSGLRAFTGDDLESIGYGLNEIIDRLQGITPVSSFRSQYAYQNMIITVGALAAANSAKKDFNLLAKDVLFNPLDMKNSGFFFKDYENAKNKAYSHVKDEKGNWAPLYMRHPDVQFGGGGASSTAQDLCNWLIMYLNKGQFKGRQVISPEALLEARTPQILALNNDKVTNFYAMGMGVEYNNTENYHAWKHSGAFTTGIRTIVYMLPEEKLGLVVLVNAFPSGLPEGLAKVLNILYRSGDKPHGLTITYDKDEKGSEGKLSILYSKEDDKELALSSYEDVKASTVSGIQSLIEESEKRPEINNGTSVPLENYVGMYKSYYYDLLDVKQANGGLEAYVGKYKVKFDLKPVQGSIFAYSYLDTSKQPMKGFLIFEIDNESNVIGAKLTGFDEDVFTKNSNKGT